MWKSVLRGQIFVLFHPLTLLSIATTWRTTTAIPKFTAGHVTFFNPQVSDWHPNLIALEALMKVLCQVLLFVIGPETRACVSMIEAAALIAAGRTVVLVIEDMPTDAQIDGFPIDQPQLKDLNRARAYLNSIAIANSTPVFKRVDEACDAIVRAFRCDVEPSTPLRSASIDISATLASPSPSQQQQMPELNLASARSSQATSQSQSAPASQGALHPPSASSTQPQTSRPGKLRRASIAIQRMLESVGRTKARSDAPAVIPSGRD